MNEQSLRIGDAVKPSPLFVEVFRRCRRRTVGQIVGESGYSDCWVVQWPEMMTRETLHVKFLEVAAPGECAAKEKK